MTGDETMSYKPSVDSVIKASSNEKEGLYEFIVHLADGSECRVSYNRFPEWQISNVSRLQKNPCPVCRKDFICDCMNRFSGVIAQQIEDGHFIEKALGE